MVKVVIVPFLLANKTVLVYVCVFCCQYGLCDWEVKHAPQGRQTWDWNRLDPWGFVRVQSCQSLTTCCSWSMGICQGAVMPVAYNMLLLIHGDLSGSSHASRLQHAAPDPWGFVRVQSCQSLTTCCSWSMGICQGPVMPVAYSMLLYWLPRQALDVIGSVLGLAGPVSVYCDWLRLQVWSTSISVWQHVQLSKIHLGDTLMCCIGNRQKRFSFSFLFLKRYQTCLLSFMF